ncbi:P-loop containing nucleoside triphosphate hydrolase protein [Trichoderma austrokoningii]
MWRPVLWQELCNGGNLSNFAYTGNDVDIGQIVEDAGLAMGLQGSGGKVFSKDVLRIEISGPTQPHLTMVDLPSLFLAGNKDQSAADSAIVKSLVLDYMKRPRSIILALQQVTEHTRSIDPNGRRTLGLITKPDTLDKGSDSQQFYVNLAENKDVHFRFGWHVLRNRDFTMRYATATERDAKEAVFFSEGVWATLKMS